MGIKMAGQTVMLLRSIQGLPGERVEREGKFLYVLEPNEYYVTEEVDAGIEGVSYGRVTKDRILGRVWF